MNIINRFKNWNRHTHTRGQRSFASDGFSRIRVNAPTGQSLSAIPDRPAFGSHKVLVRCILLLILVLTRFSSDVFRFWFSLGVCLIHIIFEFHQFLPNICLWRCYHTNGTHCLCFSNGGREHSNFILRLPPLGCTIGCKECDGQGARIPNWDHCPGDSIKPTVFDYQPNLTRVDEFYIHTHIHT